MFEIQPLSPAYPVLKPDKIKKNDNSSKQHPQENKQAPDEPTTDPLAHIDEMV